MASHSTLTKAFSGVNTNDNSSRQGVNDEAARWHVRLDSASADEQEFEAWRNADPRHAAAFARIIATSDSLDTLKGLDFTDDPDIKPVSRHTRRQFVFLAAGFVGLAGSFSLWALTKSRAQASTPIGVTKAISLPDGSQLTLNTDSKVSWKFGGKGRRMWLERGEIGVVIARNNQPCFIHAGSGIISLTEGDLNARLRDKTLDLTVLKGDCTVTNADRKTQRVTAGEAALAGPADTHIRPVSASDIQFTSGWREGELLFDGQTLGVAVEEYNRYLKDKIVIADPELASIRLGGRFKTRDPKDFIASLQSSFDIHVSQGDGGSVILSR